MKRVITLCITAAIFLTGCFSSSGEQTNDEPPKTTAPSAAAATQNPGTDEPDEQDEAKDIANIIGEGVSVNYAVTSEEAAVEITGCPAYGDRQTPYVYGKLTNGDPFDYELITAVIVAGNYYGKKPFQDSPNAFIRPDGTFTVQFSSNDGNGTDWLAENIMIFLVPSGYEDSIAPDVASGYIVPPAQISALRDDSICVVQIDREIQIQ
jgi:hypothetical protein